MKVGGNVSPWEIAAVLVRSWLTKMRIPVRRPGFVIVGLAAVLAAASALLAVLFARDFPFGYPEIFALVLIGVHLAAVFFAIFSSSATAQQSSAIAWWQAAPVSDRKLGCGLSIPVWGVSVAQAIVAVPSVVMAFGGEASVSYLQAAFLYVVALGAGTVTGRALLVLCKMGCRKITQQLTGRVQAVAAFAALLYAGMAVYAVPQTVAALAEDRTPFWAAAGYPLLLSVPLSGSAASWIGMLLWVVILCCVEVWLWPRSGLEKYDGAKVSTLGIPYAAQGCLPVFRLELMRLARSPKVQSLALISISCQLFPLILYWKFGFRFGVTGGYEVIAIMVGACMAGCYPVIARGLSDRRAPYAMVMGLGPQRWALAVNLSAILVAFTIALPFVAVWVLLVDQLPQFFVGCAVVLFASALAGVIGFILMPSSDTGFLESVVILAPFIGTALSVWTLQSFGLTDPEQFSPILFAMGVFLLFVPCVLETLRWGGVDVGTDLQKNSAQEIPGIKETIGR